MQTPRTPVSFTLLLVAPGVPSLNWSIVCADAQSNGVLAASSSGPGGNRGVIERFNGDSVTGVSDTNGVIQTFDGNFASSANKAACLLQTVGT